MAVAELFQVLYEKGIKGDRESAMYVVDQIRGKATVKFGIDEEDRDLLKASIVVEFYKLMDTHDRKALQEGYSGQGVTERTDTEEGGALQE